jgi:NAD(P)-dependent dehydrogenase (short-subunit alcohol dehydrogenase family)
MSSPVVLIMGALTGIGRANALAYAEQHATVVATGRHDEAGAEPAEDMRNAGARAAYVHTDVRHDTEIGALVDEVLERYGHYLGTAGQAEAEMIAHVPMGHVGTPDEVLFLGYATAPATSTGQGRA